MKIFLYVNNFTQSHIKNLGRPQVKTWQPISSCLSICLFYCLLQNLRKRIITAKVKPIATYRSQLVLGQSQQVIQRACALIMRVNWAMFVNTQGLRSTTAICKALNIDEPRQELVKASFSHIHKIIENKKPKQIIDKLKLPNRKTGKVYIRGGIRSVRSANHT